MASLTEADHLKTLDALERAGGNISEAARVLGMNRATFQSRVNAARLWESSRPKGEAVPTSKMTRDQLIVTVSDLKAALKSAKSATIDDEFVKQKIIGLNERCRELEVPKWVRSGEEMASSPGTPTLFLSDWHIGEYVDPAQINNVNRFDIQTARERVRRLIATTTSLLKTHMVKPNYPGIVVALGGDMVSGSIHDELAETNDMDLMPSVIELFGMLSMVIQTMADSFGRVFVPAVTGNHGRLTKKPRAKNRNFTNLDWLTYQMLAKRFEGDKRITFYIPSGSDASYALHGHRYLLTHGDQFRGGDGMIGPIGPIMRGDHKKRSRNMQIDLGYDTLMMGHFHTLMMLPKLIVNGSLKGYDEYAATNNFGFEIPQQALWMTHPGKGITFSMPVHLEDKEKARSGDGRQWLKWVA